MKGGAERWQQVRRVFEAAVGVDTDRRFDFVREACADEPGLVDEVMSLLGAHDEPETALDRPPEIEAPPADDRLVGLEGKVIGRYRLQRAIGRGGMGVVYRAARDDGELQFTVALKLVPPELASEDAARHLRQERQILTKADHPHIARLIDAGTTREGIPYLVMEYVDGQPIDQYCDARRLSVRERLELFYRICGAVAFSHEHGVIHGDIKPRNILVTPAGVPKLLDFGVARLVGTRSAREARQHDGGASGDWAATSTNSGFTPLYASPEQLVGLVATESSDVYSLGIVLYELLSGHNPRRDVAQEGDGLLARLAALRPMPPSEAVGVICSCTDPYADARCITPEAVALSRCSTPELLRTEIAAGLDTIVMKAIDKRPRRRFRNMAAMRTALDEYRASTRAHRGRWQLFLARSLVRRVQPVAIGMAAGAAVVAGVLALGAAREPYPVGHLLDSGRLVRQTIAEGVETDGALSPDASMIAYVGGLCGHTHIFVKPVDAPEPIMLTDGLPGAHRAPDWSPDGLSLIFEVEDDAGVWLYRIASTGGAPERLGAGVLAPGATEPAWSPQGDRIAYARRDGVYVFDLQAQQEYQIVEAERPSHPRWSPDGDSIAYVIPGDPETLVRLMGEPARSSIWVIDLDAGEPRQLTAGDSRDSEPMWSSNGSEVWFVSDRDGARDLYRISAERADEATRLTTGLLASLARVDGRGQRIVYAVHSRAANIHEIRLPAEGTVSMLEATRLTHGAELGVGLDVSPDGRWLVYDSDRSGVPALYKHSMLEGAARLLIELPAPAILPAWSADGRWISFYSFRESRPIGFVTDDRGYGLQQTTAGLVTGACVGAPTGQRCELQLQEEAGRLMNWVSSAGFAAGESPLALYPISLRPSPEGDLLASIGEERLRVVSRRGEVIHAVEFGTSKPLALTWMPDGTAVLVAAADVMGELEFWKVAIGGQPQLIVSSVPEVHAHPTALATDGERLFFRVPKCEADLWTIELEDA